MNDHDSAATSVRRRPHPAHWLATLLVVLAIGLFLGGYLGSRSLNPTKWEFWPTDGNHQIELAVERAQEVTLLKVRLQGLTTDTSDSQDSIGIKLPGTAKTTYIQYEYTALLGIDGENVEIHKTGDHSYRIDIPQFEYLGNDDPKFEKPIEDNGVLSFVSADVDTDAMRAKVLASESQTKLLQGNNDALQAQAELFYTNIIHAVDPDITLSFTFDGTPASK